jgi:hypothetical protein
MPATAAHVWHKNAREYKGVRVPEGGHKWAVGFLGGEDGVIYWRFRRPQAEESFGLFNPRHSQQHLGNGVYSTTAATGRALLRVGNIKGFKAFRANRSSKANVFF